MNPLNKILLGLGGSVTLVIAVVIVWLCIANAHLRVELADLRRTTMACEMTNDEFRQTTVQQNHAIQTLQAASEAQHANAIIAEKNAQRAVVMLRNHIKDLQNQKSSTNDCTSANALLNHYIAGLK